MKFVGAYLPPNLTSLILLCSIEKNTTKSMVLRSVLKNWSKCLDVDFILATIINHLQLKWNTIKYKLETEASNSLHSSFQTFLTTTETELLKKGLEKEFVDTIVKGLEK